MPGSAFIAGLMPCSCCRYLYNDKPRTVTCDCEIVVAILDNGNIQTANAVLQHFTPPAESAPTDGCLYFVSGKIASIDKDVNVGKDFEVDNYDFMIDADIVCIVPCSISYFLSPILRCTRCRTTANFSLSRPPSCYRAPCVRPYIMTLFVF
jgi:hypothetical protein